MLFFFSSRRRHTRCSRDWSSDVCSSDLVRVQYGECPKIVTEGEGQVGNSPQAFNCTILLEAPSPIVNVPADLNLEQLAETGLQLAGMSAVQAREFCQTVDWKSTLVLPITRFVRSYATVTVDGVHGTLMTPANRRGPGLF